MKRPVKGVVRIAGKRGGSIVLCRRATDAPQTWPVSAARRRGRGRHARVVAAFARSRSVWLRRSCARGPRRMYRPDLQGVCAPPQYGPVARQPERHDTRSVRGASRSALGAGADAAVAEAAALPVPQPQHKPINIDFPTAASIPAVSIMNSEPTGPVVPGAAAAAASESEPASRPVCRRRAIRGNKPLFPRPRSPRRPCRRRARPRWNRSGRSRYPRSLPRQPRKLRRRPCPRRRFNSLHLTQVPARLVERSNFSVRPIGSGG